MHVYLRKLRRKMSIPAFFNSGCLKIFQTVYAMFQLHLAVRPNRLCSNCMHLSRVITDGILSMARSSYVSVGFVVFGTPKTVWHQMSTIFIIMKIVSSTTRHGFTSGLISRGFAIHMQHDMAVMLHSPRTATMANRGSSPCILGDHILASNIDGVSRRKLQVSRQA